MSDAAATDFREPRPHVRLDTILRLRWLAVLGQLATIFVVEQALDFELPLIPCLSVIAFSAIVNIVLQIAFNPMRRLKPKHAAALLALMIAELDALLFLTGGIDNPFAILVLAPTLIAATALPPRLTLALAAFAAASATALAIWHLPLPWSEDDPLVLPATYNIAVWISTIVAIGVTSLYAFQATEQARKLSDALAAAELVLTREQHLTQLDGLAAAAAHELGTPLSTITLIVRELEKSLDPTTPIAADIRTLREQTQRCRDILAKLTQLSSTGAPFDRMRVSALVEEAVAPYRDFGITIKVRQTAPGKNEPVTRRNPGVLYGLGNILENAVDFARETVEVDAWWDQRNVEIVIADDGPGIAPDILRKIGEPYLSRRPNDSGSGGLGLGVFIARTLLERSGARVSFRNRIFPAHGAIVHITWPRETFEIDDVPPEPAD
ncbi:ActS/PrrB/RegB family redox-sensitive histidine kinase [Bradyrhizobium sp. LHD-71]|uniref:ActS/PrrB/RegB family redox-sensitive histidine kinase n=1 Tax=Bradyrhizobium sp. LHD-71 TaxID=3072141 RepID=UPI00280FE527|nr:ActS/PrrB/RegB family redox-sensitive histidine kinase [Bradyrhizobium sp. LHD-71]MDQ8732675.1 ActS/PrrB/RegB family redox-sensitive histidine kinase [Bradyrhizobium sp. LHD-71]